MAESLVVSGLVSKRSEVAGQIISYQAEITRLQESLSHLDGSIKLFAPEYDLRTIKSKRTNISSSIRIDRQHPLQSRRRRLGSTRCKADVVDWGPLQAGLRHSLPKPECRLRPKPGTHATWPRLTAARSKRTVGASPHHGAWNGCVRRRRACCELDCVRSGPLSSCPTRPRAWPVYVACM